MPLFRPAKVPPPGPDRPEGGFAPLSGDDLFSPEDLAERRQRRRRLWLLLGLILAAVGIGFAARPALHVAKAWQARRTAAEAERFTREHKWFEARNKVQDALQLWQHEPEAQRAAAIFLARTGNWREATAFWKRVELARPLTRDEQREYAEALLASGEVELAADHLRQAWSAGQEGTPSDWELGMRIAVRRNAGQETLALARRLLASRASTARQRLTASLTLLSAAGEPGTQKEALAEICALAQDKQSPESLDALLVLARWIGLSPGGVSSAAAAGLALPTVAELIDRIDAHPLARIQHHLLAFDLRIASEPARRAEWVQAAVDRFAGTPENADLTTLGAWLYGKGEYARVLDVIPPIRATDDRALFFQRLDALGAMDRWADIRAAIQSHKVVVDPMIEQMYLARCADKLGEPQVRDARWDGALDAAGASPQKLLQLGRYAEKSGQTGVAEKAYRAALQAAPESREAYGALLGILEAAGETRKLRETLATVLKLWPEDAAARNDGAYFDALVGENLRGARDVAEQLVRAEPLSLPPRVTLALAELRLGHDLAALDAFKGINITQAVLLPRQRAVYAAVLSATNYGHEARETLRLLPAGHLLPEERILVQAIPESGPE